MRHRSSTPDRPAGLCEGRAVTRLVSRLAPSLAVALALAACASAPPTHLHTLMAADPPLRAADAAAPSELPVALDVRVPAQVDQPQWLVRLPDDSVAVLEQERWASPLRDELKQALLEEIVVRYGAIEPRGQSAGTPVLRVTVDVRRFDSVPGREARIEGSWAIAHADPRAPVSHCDWLMREAAAGGMPALAAAHRRAVARLGDAIGESLLRLRRGQTQTCPARDESR
jgi:uncharacterized lipoprotein YmbA